MKKKFLVLILVLSLSVCALASCIKECEHTFSDEWYSDAENHWHPATCEHGEEHSDFGAHVDADEDSICDICSLEVGHNHSFASEWSTDDTHHWYAATCTHTNQKKDNGLHADGNLDSRCDSCGHHVHDVNAAGYCKHADCGEKVIDVNEEDLSALVNAVLCQAGKVNGGHIEYTITSPSRESNDYYSFGNKTVDFLLGNGSSYYKTFSNNHAYDNGLPIETSSTVETWHEANGDETFSLELSNDSEAVTLVASDPAKLIGYYYTLSSLADGDGAEALLANLVTLTADPSVIDFKVVFDPEANNVSFNFKILVVQETTIFIGDNAGETVYNANYYDVSASFTYTEDFVLTGLELTLDRYTNDAGALRSGAQNLADIDIQYDPETGDFWFVKYNKETKEFEAADSAPADRYTYSVTQTVGERGFENPYTKSQFIPESFDLYFDQNDDGTLANKYTGDVINVDVYKIVNLYVGECLPAGTSVHFIADMVEVKLYRDGNQIIDPPEYGNQTAVAMLTFAGEQRNFFFIAKEEGLYTLEISLMGKTYYTIKINAGNVSMEELELEDNQFAVRVTEAYEWANEVTFTAPEAGKYYFNLPSGVGFIDADAYDEAEKTPATDDSPKPYFDYNNAEIVNGVHRPGSFSLTLEEGQTVRFYVNAVEKGLYVISYFN